MGSHVFLVAEFPRISERRARSLERALRALDDDLDVVVYGDGIHGDWRNPLRAEADVRALVEKHVGVVDAWFFNPLWCDEAAIWTGPGGCDCSSGGLGYGCTFREIPQSVKEAVAFLARMKGAHLA